MKAKFHPVLKYCAGYTMPSEMNLPAYITKLRCEFCAILYAITPLLKWGENVIKKIRTDKNETS